MPSSLQTKRLILRSWRDEDIEPYAAMNSDPVVMEHFPKLASREESEQMVIRFRKHFEDNAFGLWAVELKSTGEFMGFIGLQRIPFEAHFTPCIEIGWRLGHKFWGNGYAPEGALETLRDAFERLDVDEIVSITATTNKNSMRVMEKIGMTRNIEDDFDHPRLEAGHRLQRHVLYRISRQKWNAQLENAAQVHD